MEKSNGLNKWSRQMRGRLIFVPHSTHPTKIPNHYLLKKWTDLLIFLVLIQILKW